ncbi:MAG: hypothetical protein VB127_07635 [Sphaerochaeta sp.]|nr:hypothetical protein [Sphaerochaeta sp.]
MVKAFYKKKADTEVHWPNLNSLNHISNDHLLPIRREQPFAVDLSSSRASLEAFTQKPQVF